MPEAVKSERLARLQDLLNQQQIEFNEWIDDELVPVLLDRYGRRDSQLAGAARGCKQCM